MHGSIISILVDACSVVVYVWITLYFPETILLWQISQMNRLDLVKFLLTFRPLLDCTIQVLNRISSKHTMEVEIFLGFFLASSHDLSIKNFVNKCHLTFLYRNLVHCFDHWKLSKYKIKFLILNIFSTPYIDIYLEIL